jgi:hypothetical protein
MKFRVYRDDRREWRWSLRACNGETIASGEGYKRRKDAMSAISIVQHSVGASVVVEVPLPPVVQEDDGA